MMIMLMNARKLLMQTTLFGMISLILQEISFLKQNVFLKNFLKELNDQRKVRKCFRRL